VGRVEGGFFLVEDFPQPHSTGAGSFFLALEVCDTRVDLEDRTWAGRLPLASTTTEPPAGKWYGSSCYRLDMPYDFSEPQIDNW
jgi:hypothetical protein